MRVCNIVSKQQRACSVLEPCLWPYMRIPTSLCCAISRLPGGSATHMLKRGRAQADLQWCFSSLSWCWEEQKQVGPKVMLTLPWSPVVLLSCLESSSWWAFVSGNGQTLAGGFAVKMASFVSDAVGVLEVCRARSLHLGRERQRWRRWALLLWLLLDPCQRLTAERCS